MLKTLHFGMAIMLSLLLACLSLAPIGLAWLGPIALTPLFYQVATEPEIGIKEGCIQGLLFGFALGIYCYMGVIAYSPTLFLPTISAIALSFALLFAAVSQLYAIPLAAGPLAIALVATFIELVLNNIGIPFSFALFALDTPLRGQAAILGSLSISFSVVFIPLAALCLLSAFRRKQSYKSWLAPTMGLALVLGFTVFSDNLLKAAPQPKNRIAVAAMQTHIDPNLEKLTTTDGGLANLASIRNQLLNQLDNSNSKPDLIVWPETWFAGFEFQGARLPKMKSKKEYAELVASPDISPHGRSSAIFAVSKQGEVLSRHEKSRLVPIVESHFKNGTQFFPHNALEGKPGSLICLESAFAKPSVLLAKNGAGFITIATSDAYAGPSFLPEIHAQLARLRAVETSRAIVRAANAGPSMIINSRGNIVSRLPLFEEGVIAESITINFDNNFYVTHYQKITTAWWLISIAATTFLLSAARSTWGKQAEHIASPRHSAKNILAITLVALFCCATQTIYISNIYRKAQDIETSITPLLLRTSIPESSLIYDSLKASKIGDSSYSALAFLLRELGIDTNLAELQALHAQLNGHQAEETTIDTLARYIGIETSWHSDDSVTKLVATPFLVEFNSSEVLCLRAVEKDRAILFSPLRGREVAITIDAFIEAWTGNSLRVNFKDYSAQGPTKDQL